MKIEIYDDKKDKLVFEGIYEFLEGGFEKDGRPSFHIEAHSPGFKETYSVFFYCDNKEEVEKLIESLTEQILK